MSEQKSEVVALNVATISDRGLSEKRPVNEDSFLSDPVRGIFAVADGVGGAQAGEVASKTAVEVLDEAFRHHMDGADIEDLMEIAIQRANSSIYQMSHEHQKLSAMATTIVALHIDGRIATIGHVGDSRLYRLSPEGKLHRETADHSVVEEEVRAGRMTPEQAAHHPSRNVISRALGAESSVEVDMKTIEVNDGTIFLLCSDGITRHIPDNELRQLLAGASGLNELCAEMKRICFERGAEDNLTAVIVRVGEGGSANGFYGADEERTVSTIRSPEFDTTAPGFAVEAPPQAIAAPPATPAPLPETPPPAPQITKEDPPPANPVLAMKEFAATNKRKGGAARSLLLLLLIAGIGAAAFYGGMYFQRQRAAGDPAATTTASPIPTATATPADLIAEFEKKRQQVDRAPAQMVKTMGEEMAARGTSNPLDSTDPEFLYLYGRALLLMGDNIYAMTAFEKANDNLKENTSELHDKLRVETRLAALATALRLRVVKPDPLRDQRVLGAFDELINKGISPTVSQ
jgi:protein phosphatase